MRGRQLLLIILCIVALVIIFQNTDVVSLKFLAWEWRLSRIILLFFTLLIGILIGIVATVSKKNRHSN